MNEYCLLSIIVVFMIFIATMFNTLVNKINDLNEINNQVKEMTAIKEYLVSFKMGCKVREEFSDFYIGRHFYDTTYSHEKHIGITNKYNCNSILVEWNRIYLISGQKETRIEHNIDCCGATPEDSRKRYKYINSRIR